MGKLNLGFYESSQAGLPIERLVTSKIESTPPTQKQIDRSNEMVKEGLPEELRQIEFHLGNAKENLTNSQDAVANCDARLASIEIALAKLQEMTMTGIGMRKLDEVLEQKEKVTIERQNWIRQVGRYTKITKTWQDRYDAFDFDTLKELRAEEEALAAINL
jgi:hypothetical protein